MGDLRGSVDRLRSDERFRYWCEWGVVVVGLAAIVTVLVIALPAMTEGTWG